MTPQKRFLKACRCENRDRPPVWLMRQAGRALPEYRALRENHDFLEMLSTPELITEISLQPWHRFKMDAVIMFSDILLLPWKMGMDLKFIEGQGPKFSKLISSEKDLKLLKPIDPKTDCPFLLHALREIKKEIGEDAALLGFAGSPWTVASYIMDMTGVIASEAKQSPSVAKGDCFGLRPRNDNDANPRNDILRKVLERLTQETITYLGAQINAGVDAVQIFDSWGGTLSAQDYAIWSAPYIKEVVQALKPTGLPIIIYVKESNHLLDQMIATGADVISVGWETPLSRCLAPSTQIRFAIQGNFNPHILMQATPEEVREKTQNMLEEMRGYPGYIANLGHGVLPKTPLENLEAFVGTVKNSKS